MQLLNGVIGVTIWLLRCIILGLKINSVLNNGMYLCICMRPSLYWSSYLCFSFRNLVALYETYYVLEFIFEFFYKVNCSTVMLFCFSTCSSCFNVIKGRGYVSRFEGIWICSYLVNWGYLVLHSQL